MNDKRNVFTLIELLVVIAIIAILGRTSASGYGAVGAAPLAGGVIEFNLIATNRTCPIDNR